MHIDIIPNRNSKPAVLLRESYRDGKTVRKRTLANLSDLPLDQVEAIRRILKGEKLHGIDDLFETVTSFHHGHVKAVLFAMEKLGFDKIIASRPSRERSLILAVIAAQILAPKSKLAITQWWKLTTLPDELDVRDADEDDLYNAMDWLLERQNVIEKKLANRHLMKGGLVLYDLTSSYFEGTKCPLAKYGYNRDGKKGKLQINYGLLTDERGCPVSVSVFEGNVSDPQTLMPSVDKVRDSFGIKDMILVGDRGMISQKQIDSLSTVEGISWITALKTGAIADLVRGGSIQMELFDERNLFEIEHPDYPNERLVACRNPELAKLRAHKRKSLLESTKKELEKVQSMTGKGRLKNAASIGVRIGKIINKYKVAKHFILDVRDDGFDYRINEESVAIEAALDGIYVIRTNVRKERISAEATVHSYKKLSQVERAFRSFKTIDLHVRPIRHRLEKRVRAHIFLCMLAYYVEWHMKEALRPILFADEDQETKTKRDPVAPARRSPSAIEKIRTKKTKEGLKAHSFRTLIDHLAGIVKNLCRRKGSGEVTEGEVIIETTPDKIHERTFDLLKEITM